MLTRQLLLQPPQLTTDLTFIFIWFCKWRWALCHSTLSSTLNVEFKLLSDRLQFLSRNPCLSTFPFVFAMVFRLFSHPKTFLDWYWLLTINYVVLSWFEEARLRSISNLLISSNQIINYQDTSNLSRQTINED